MYQNEQRSAIPSSVPLLVLLAAGAGSRFDGPTHKLNARLRDRTIAGQAIANAVAADAGDVAIVIGATPLTELVTAGPELAVIENPNWSAGQATSLIAAVDYARARAYPAIVVGLADQPFIRPDSWRAIATSSAPIAYATYDGQRGHPIRLAAQMWSDLPTTGDEGARSLIRLRQDVSQAIPCSGSAADIDTLEDLTQWQKHSSTNSPSTDRSTRPGH